MITTTRTCDHCEREIIGAERFYRIQLNVVRPEQTHTEVLVNKTGKDYCYLCVRNGKALEGIFAVFEQSERDAAVETVVNPPTGVAESQLYFDSRRNRMAADVNLTEPIPVTAERMKEVDDAFAAKMSLAEAMRLLSRVHTFIRNVVTRGETADRMRNELRTELVKFLSTNPDELVKAEETRRHVDDNLLCRAEKSFRQVLDLSYLMADDDRWVREIRNDIWAVLRDRGLL